jgi:uncharacterized protein
MSQTAEMLTRTSRKFRLKDAPATERRPVTPVAEVRNVPGKGRGVFALVDIAAGDLIERSPVLLIPAGDRANVDTTIIFTYVFMWEHGTTEQDLYSGKGRAAIALGLASLLNHSFFANATFIRHIDELELEIRANQSIPRGSEIMIDYQMKLWFDPE